MCIYSIGASAFRMRIIHRHNQRFALGMCPIIHRIQVREELMPQFQAFAHDPFGHGIVVPRFFIDKRTAGRVQTIDRREYAVLHPARRQVVVTVSVKMAADIMAPPSVTDVGGSGSKLRLIIQRFPCYDCITRESNRITLTARTAVAREEHGAFSVALNIQNMQMI